MFNQMKRSIAVMVALLMLFQLTAVFAQDSVITNGETQESSVKIVEVQDNNTDNAEIVPGKVLVKYKESVSVKAQGMVAQSVSATSVKSFGNVGVSSLSISKKKDVFETIEELENDPNVEYAEPVYIVKSSIEAPETEEEPETIIDSVYAPEDDYFVKRWQWGLEAINPTGLWAETSKEEIEAITIAIVDTGVDLDHPELADSIVAGYDFINSDNDPDDDGGHGTHVAGIAAAISDDENGMAGVAGGCKIMPVKVLDENGSGTTETVMHGINYAVANGADVINLSLGFQSRSMAVEDAIENALAQDIVVVAAVGNRTYEEEELSLKDSGQDFEEVQVTYPAAYEGVIGVGAVDWEYDEKDEEGHFSSANFSITGSDVDVVAPGVDIFSTLPLDIDSSIGMQGYDLMKGTSMATPFVSGLVALIKANNETLEYGEVLDILRDDALDLGSEGKDDRYGYGLVNGSEGEIYPPYKHPVMTYCGLEQSEKESITGLDAVFSLMVKGNKSDNYIADDSAKGSVDLILQEYMTSEDGTITFTGEKEISVVDIVYGMGKANFSITGDEGKTIAIYGDGKGDFINSDYISGAYIPITGTISLPEGQVAPEGGLDITVEVCLLQEGMDMESVNVKSLDNSQDVHSLIEETVYERPLYIYKEVTIPSGEQDGIFSITHFAASFSQAGIKYYLDDEDRNEYFETGYYNSNGTAVNAGDAELLDLHALTTQDINITIIDMESVTDDFGNDSSEAYEVNIGEEIDATINYNGDQDWFKFEVTEQGGYAIQTTGDLDTHGYLFNDTIAEDTSATYLADDYYRGKDKNFLIAKKLEPGVYYVKVKGKYDNDIGAYGFRVTKAEFKNNDTIEEAESTEIDELLDAAIDYENDEDWYSFEVDEIGKYVIETTGNIDTYGYLYNFEESMMESDDDDGVDCNFNISRELNPGVYYIKVRGFSSSTMGDYNLSVSKVHPEEEVNDTLEAAQYIQIDEKIGGTFSSDTDEDWYSFSITEPGFYKIMTAGNTNTVGVLYSSNAEELNNDDNSGYYSNFSIMAELEAGTYYVQTKASYYNSGSTNDYIFNVSKYIGGETTAQEIAIGQKIEETISQEEEEDWYKFIVEEADYYEIRVVSDEDTDLYFNSGATSIQEAQTLSSENVKESGLSSELEDGKYERTKRRYLEPDTYYFSVERDEEFESSDYTVSVDKALVEFEDENLKEVVLESLGNDDVFMKSVSTLGIDLDSESDEKERIYKYQVRSIKKLNAENREISNIEGLQYFENLEELNIVNNSIIDLSPLGGLENLYYLDMSDNTQITDISVISDLPGLTDIRLANNANIEDLSPLASHVGLVYLNLSGIGISDINMLSDFQYLAHLKLDSNNITDLSPLANITSLVELSIKDNSITNIKDLKGLVNLRILYLAGNEGLTDFSPTKAFYNNLYEKDFVIKSTSSGGSSGGGGSSTPSNETKNETGTVKVKKDKNGKVTAKVDVDKDAVDKMIKDDKSTSVTIDAKSGEETDKVEVEMSADILSNAEKKGKSLVIETDEVSFEIEPGTLDADEGDELYLSVEEMSVDDIKDEVDTSASEKDALTAVFDFELFLGGKKITNFNKPMTVTIQFDTSNVSDTDKVGVYYYNEKDGEWEYVGGTVNEDGTITFTVEHFSKYAVMEFKKTFNDIQNHWAKASIEKMAARNIVKGVGGTENFAPNQKITRAEFAALITRALELNNAENKNSDIFTDIETGAWYQGAVQNAYNVNIVNGIGDDQFAPDEYITREQMATMIMRAYEYKSGEKLGSIVTSQEVRFSDEGKASKWAGRNIILANAKGLMGGYPDGSFKPKANTTRAEAVVTIMNLLVELGVVSQ